MSPASIISPTFTKGRCVMQVFWFERWNFNKLYMSTPGVETSALVASPAPITMRVASTWTTLPDRRATIVTPESRATCASMPVPTNGASLRTNGTAWRCILEPIKARFASSFSRKGINAAATDTICLGETSIKSISSERAWIYSPPARQLIKFSIKLFLSSSCEFACATVYRPSSIADI